ncbi:UNVERIFIED_ORG: hypothetical protein GGI63_002364 [Rhizobium esperanzae]|nr:hypothetical protein RHECNPAF_1140024 [Rhizobium etli CNPAF512]
MSARVPAIGIFRQMLSRVAREEEEKPVILPLLPQKCVNALSLRCS